MKKYKETRTIHVSVIEFDNGVKIDSSDIMMFLDEAYNFEDTIGESGNYTDDYLYFKTEVEKKLEPILLEYDVIRKACNREEHNKKVGSDNYHKYYYYWLSDGYHKFYRQFWDLINADE